MPLVGDPVAVRVAQHRHGVHVRVGGEDVAAWRDDLLVLLDRLAARGIRFLGYVNPYLAVDGDQFREAEAGGHLALKLDKDEPYLVDFGEFDCGVIDFTREETCAWFAEKVLGHKTIHFEQVAGSGKSQVPFDCVTIEKAS